jgi:hypothetical protein
MSFTDKQRRRLTAKLKHQHVKTRSSQGGTISYVEGWHVIAEANRIFGHDCWDRKTLSPRCVWSHHQTDQSAVFYTTKVCITVRADGDLIVREGIGTGFARAPSAEVAHDIALKAAETDATKRALATFGNPFGLALYDKGQAGVTKPPRTASIKKPTFALRRNENTEVLFNSPSAFMEAVLTTIRSIDDITALYAFWDRNRSSLTALTRALHERNRTAPTDIIVAALKARAQVLGGTPTEKPGALAFPKETRLRNKEHLKFVAQQACLICGRRPTHAHHVRFAQMGALGMKVSDEFTVPLCSVHHDAVHRTGNEKSWWMSQAIEPLKAAAQLWAATQGRQEQDGSSDPDAVDTPPADANGRTNGIDGGRPSQ